MSIKCRVLTLGCRVPNTECRIQSSNYEVFRIYQGALKDITFPAYQFSSGMASTVFGSSIRFYFLSRSLSDASRAIRRAKGLLAYSADPAKEFFGESQWNEKNKYLRCSKCSKSLQTKSRTGTGRGPDALARSGSRLKRISRKQLMESFSIKLENS